MKPDFTAIRWAALFEGSSLIVLLFVAMPLKYHAGIPEAVKIIGPIHGILFLGFIYFLFSHAEKGDLNLIKTVAGLIASFIPFGTFIYKAIVLKPSV
jgi:integral membrane protein